MPHLPRRKTVLPISGMFTAGPGRWTQAEVRVRRSIPLPGWVSEVCLLMGHTDCCLLAGGSFRLELPLNSSVWQREGEGWSGILDALGAGAAASVIDWLFDLRQNRWTLCAQRLCPPSAASSLCSNMSILIRSSLNTLANQSSLCPCKGGGELWIP